VFTVAGDPLARARALVWNDAERRPRAPLRLLAGGVVVAVVQFGLVVGVSALASSVWPPVLLAALTLVVIGGTGLGALVAGVVIDRRTVADLGLGVDRDWWLDFAFGLALGVALLTGVFAVSLAAGWIRVVGRFAVATGSAFGDFLGNFLFALALFVVVGVSEELLARGYLLTNLAEGLDGFGPVGRRGAVGLAVLGSSAVFGLLHAGNPNATAVSTAALSLAGVFLATGYVLTDDLAIPIGLHITWNLFQGPVYGFPVSGTTVGVSVLALSEQGPDVWTGGRFGPEAGLLGLLAILVGIAAIVVYVRYRYGSVAVPPGVTAPSLRWRGDP
jgi:membrane protease YdiL (CAAX protease family)